MSHDGNHHPEQPTWKIPALTGRSEPGWHQRPWLAPPPARHPRPPVSPRTPPPPHPLAEGPGRPAVAGRRRTGRRDPSGNRSPAIEDPGLSSVGLTLTVAPTVSDPDGDEVTVEIEADGEQLPAGNGSAQRTYPYQDSGPSRSRPSRSWPWLPDAVHGHRRVPRHVQLHGRVPAALRLTRGPG
jgi:hypothetical protein